MVQRLEEFLERFLWSWNYDLCKFQQLFSGVMIDAALGILWRRSEWWRLQLTSHFSQIYSKPKLSDVEFHFSCHRRASSWALWILYDLNKFALNKVILGGHSCVSFGGCQNKESLTNARALVKCVPCDSILLIIRSRLLKCKQKGERSRLFAFPLQPAGVSRLECVITTNNFSLVSGL